MVSKFLKRSKPPRRETAPLGTLTALGTRSGAESLPLPERFTKLIAPGYPLVDGPHYHDVLAEFHVKLRPEWYLEIGTNEGNSLAYVPGNFVSIDPDFIFENFSMKTQEFGHFLQQTSDAFFESRFLEKNDISPSLGFLDGLHQFEFLLRDFMNFEKAAAPSAVAILHDCLPWNAVMAERAWDRERTSMWTGDVWKVLAIILQNRPDLEIRVLDAFPTGLVVIRGLDPTNTQLDEAYERCLEAFDGVTLEQYGIGKFFDSFEIESAYKFVAALEARPV